jgi:hypothetical protein
VNVTDFIYKNQYTEDLPSRLSGAANIFCECSCIRMDVASEKLLVYGNLVADAVDSFSWKKDPSAALFSSEQRRLKGSSSEDCWTVRSFFKFAGS